MKCKLCEDKLLEYLYGELGEEDAAAMEQHLKASEACRRACDGFASVLDTVSGVEEQEPPPAMHTRILGHAKEARVGRRSFWARMLRPAVTTAVIGALTAGVYFATLRHKPPGRLDERILSEESSLGKVKQRSTPSPSDAKTHAPAKEAARQAERAAVAEPPGVIERDEGEREPQKVLKESEPLRPKSPALQAEPSTAADALDEERMPAPAQRKGEAVSAGADRALGEGVESKTPPVSNTRALPMAFRASSEKKPATLERAEVPHAIAQALDLASKGHCGEAEERVRAFSAEHPEEAACGTGWLEAARCYARKGDKNAARETAEKALGIPGCTPEARALLESLSPPADDQQTGAQE